jgi:hypothetical protein
MIALRLLQLWLLVGRHVSSKTIEMLIPRNPGKHGGPLLAPAILFPMPGDIAVPMPLSTGVVMRRFPASVTAKLQ